MTDSNTPQITQRDISLLWAGAEIAGEIAKIQSDVNISNWSEDGVRDLLADPASNSLVAKVRLHPDNQPISAGFVMGRIAADEVEILSIGVLIPFQRFGIGRQLVEGLFRAAKRAEAAKMFLEVAETNEPAIALYSGLGFVESGRRNGYYKNSDGTSVDALLMSRAL